MVSWRPDIGSHRGSSPESAGRSARPPTTSETAAKRVAHESMEQMETEPISRSTPHATSLKQTETQKLPEEAKQSVNSVFTLIANLAKNIKEIGSPKQPTTQTAQTEKRNNLLGDFVRSVIIFPLSGKKDPEASENLKNTVKLLAEGFPKDNSAIMVAEKVNIPVKVGGKERHLEAMHLTHGNGKGPTVVLFHANGQTASHLYNQTQYYHSMGFNVLVPTMGGYPGSPGVATSEESACQDVEAVKKFLLEKGVTEAGYHGVSIGGALAFQAATGETNCKNLKTLFVAADQTFDTIPNVCSNYLKNWNVPGPICSLAKAAGNLAMPKKQNLQIAKGLVQTSDGLDNKAKSEELKNKNIPLFTLTATKDEHMGKKKGRNLLDGIGEEKNRAVLEGGHMTSFYKSGKVEPKIDLFVSNIANETRATQNAYLPEKFFK